MSFWDDFEVEEAANESSGGEYKPVPDGWYDVLCENAETKKNKNGQGEHISATFVIVSEEYKGRKVFVNWNTVNPNETAQKIGRGELARFCKAAGLESPKDESDLVDLMVRVKIGRDKKDAERNTVKAYKSIDDGACEPAEEPAKKEEPAKAKAKPAKAAPWSK